MAFPLKFNFFGTIDKFCIQDIIIPFGSLMQEEKDFRQSHNSLNEQF